ncbi:Conserved_hypothetical protein [Hexamita inflata]|uniref:Uncharacterized protein n=1 Tax=Hexamita inflata TaxID=28002 RepID=A0AA86U5N2_9EUKA|nr:Conserved hypothetical protein [Hexamita inflata]
MIQLILSFTATDLECMKQLYASANGQKWTTQTNWQSDDVCSFYGITCDENKVVTGIDLSSNNLVGALPACLQEMKGLLALGLAHNDFKNAEFDYRLLNTLTSINIENCHFVSTQGNAVMKATRINFKNNDFSLTSIDFSDSSLQNATRIDITNSSVMGGFDISSFKKLVDFSAAKTQINLMMSPSISSTLRSIDVSYTPTKLDVEQLYAIIATSQVKIIGFKRTNLYGKAPKSNTNLFVSDLSENAFVCRDDSQSMFDCTFLQIKGVFTKQNKISVQFESNKRLPTMQMVFLQRLGVYVKNLQTSTDIVTEVLKLSGCEASSSQDYTYYLTCDSTQQIEKIEDVAIVYGDKAVSTGSLLVVKEINELLANVGEETPNYFQRRNMKRIDYQTKPQRNQQPIKMEQHQKQPVTATKKITFDVTAYSKCPDYINFVDNLYQPFVTKYPLIAKYLTFNYVSMAKAEPMNVAKASSLHGQFEGHMDIIYACMQKYSPENFWDAQMCYTHQESCLRKHILDYDIASTIELCADGEEGMNLLKNDDAWLIQHGTEWSPTLYMNDKYLCLWNSVDGMPEEDCGKKFADIDAFAKFVCADAAMNTAAECKEL